MTEVAYIITIAGQDGAFACPTTERVLLAMERSGRKMIPVGCRGGGCGFCKVRVLGGRYHTGRMSSAHISESEQATGYALACRIYPESDLLLQVIGPKPRQGWRVRNAAANAAP